MYSHHGSPTSGNSTTACFPLVLLCSIRVLAYVTLALVTLLSTRLGFHCIRQQDRCILVRTELNVELCLNILYLLNIDRIKSIAITEGLSQLYCLSTSRD